MDKINGEEGPSPLLTCANNFLPQNNRGPNELSAQHVKREQMLFTLSRNPGDPDRACTCASARARTQFLRVRIFIWVNESAWCCIVIAHASVCTPVQAMIFHANRGKRRIIKQRFPPLNT